MEEPQTAAVAVQAEEAAQKEAQAGEEAQQAAQEEVAGLGT